MNKTMTLWNVPVEIVPAILEQMNKRACSLLLEEKYDEANDVIWELKRIRTDYLNEINGGDEE